MAQASGDAHLADTLPTSSDGVDQHHADATLPIMSYTVGGGAGDGGAGPQPPPPHTQGAATAAVHTLLTPRAAANLRSRPNIAGTGKKDLRAFMDEISTSQTRDPNQLVWDIPEEVPWRHYIARQPDW